MTELKRLEHGMLLDGKYVKEDALSALATALEHIVAPAFLPELHSILRTLEDELVECDVSERYEEKPTSDFEKKRIAFLGK